MIRVTLDLILRLANSDSPHHSERLKNELRTLLETGGAPWLADDFAYTVEAFEVLWSEALDSERTKISEQLTLLIGEWLRSLNEAHATNAIQGLISIAYRLHPPIERSLKAALLKSPTEFVAKSVLAGQLFGSLQIPSDWIAVGYGFMLAQSSPEDCSDSISAISQLLSSNYSTEVTRFRQASRWLFAAIDTNRADLVRAWAAPWLSFAEGLSFEQLDVALDVWDNDAVAIEARCHWNSISELLLAWFFTQFERALCGQTNLVSDRLARSLDRLCHRTRELDGAFASIIHTLSEQAPLVRRAGVRPIQLLDYLRNEGGNLEAPAPGELIQWTKQAMTRFVKGRNVLLTERYENAPKLRPTDWVAEKNKSYTQRGAR